MSTTMEWIARAPRAVLPERSDAAARPAVRPMAVLGGVAWLVQAAGLALLTYFLLGDVTADLLNVIGNGSAATWQVFLAVVTLVTPGLAAAWIAVRVRGEGESIPLMIAAMAATVLAVGLLEMGLTALVILFAGA